MAGEMSESLLSMRESGDRRLSFERVDAVQTTKEQPLPVWLKSRQEGRRLTVKGTPVKGQDPHETLLRKTSG